MIWLQFLICAAVILYSGTRLSEYGDVIAEKTGMGRTWIGVVLMASVTSLPELVTGITSVAVYDLPNIAAGDVLGSCMFNLLLLGMLDLKRDGSPLSVLAHPGQILSAAFGVLLLGMTAVGILVGGTMPAWGWIGIYSPALLVVYLIAMRLVFSYEQRRIAEFLTEVAEPLQYGGVSSATAYGRFGLHALVIVAAATYLPHVGEEIAAITGLGKTFVGSIFIALSTSLPEVVVSRAALRIGAVDLAVGNILGSNLFNIGILAIDDIFYAKGPLLGQISSSHTVTAIAAMAMTAIMIIALAYRSPKRVLFFTWDALGIALIFGLATFLLYTAR
jgi:cation:H+ antiporter